MLDRDYWRATRRGYRYRRRRPFWGFLLFVLLMVGIWSSLHILIPLAIIGIICTCIFIGIRNSMFGSGNWWSSSGNSTYQQPNPYYQPPQQPSQPNQYYQPSAPAQPNTPYTAPYQPYGQGYQPPPQNDYQQETPVYQDNPAQPTAGQYEEPMAQYPQEMPPMG